MKIELTSGETVEARPGESVMAALRREKVYLVASCGGKGTCGKCRIRVLSGETRVEGRMKMSGSEAEEGFALACRTLPLGDCRIEVPRTSRLVVGDKIAVGRADDLLELLRRFSAPLSPLSRRLSLTLPPPDLADNVSDLERLKRSLDEAGVDASQLRVRFELLRDLPDALRAADWKVTVTLDEGEAPELLDIRPGHERGAGYGLAVDIGTTTVVVYLVDLSDGRLVDVGSTYNSQMRYGDDVINRIVQATEEGRLNELRAAVRSDINDLLDPITERHGIGPGEIDSVVIAGNTTMTQLFFGINPRYIREEPYIPAANRYPEFHAGQLGLRTKKGAPVHAVPCVASYVGGDIVAGVLASGMTRRESFSLFMDIGTNGEIALGNNEMLMTAACSAGPCFEGSGIRCGMRATAGAIEGVEFSPETLEPHLTVIGGGEPLGICGSGMIDAIGDMFLKGIIDQKGRLQPVSPRVRRGDEGPEYLLHRGADGREIVLTEPDIENILRAKAAIHAGFQVLLNELGFTLEMVERIYIAGGFGNYLNVEKAILLGMLPDVARNRFEFLGNTSVTGAYLCLLSKAMREEAEAIASKMTYLELSVSSAFMDEYTSALFLPHTDMARYPSVQALLEKQDRSEY